VNSFPSSLSVLDSAPVPGAQKLQFRGVGLRHHDAKLDFAATVLAEPEPHVGKAYPLVGAMLSQRQVASEFSAALNRRVEYVEIKFEQFREALTRQMPDNPVAVTHLSILWGQVLQEPLGQGLKRVGEQAGSMDEMLEIIPQIGGVAPHTLQSFVRERTGKDARSFAASPARA
jgi:hypothetical protein